MRLILFVSVDKKVITPHNEWLFGYVLVCAHFLAHLSTKCSVSFCDPSMSVVRACVNNFFKQHLL